MSDAEDSGIGHERSEINASFESKHSHLCVAESSSPLSQKPLIAAQKCTKIVSVVLLGNFPVDIFVSEFCF